MKPLDQLQKEWLFINASRELLSLFKNIPAIRYADSIRFAKDIYSPLFDGSTTGIGKKDRLDKLLEKFEQEAYAKSKKLKKSITSENVIRNRLNEVNRLLKEFSDRENPYQLRKEASDLTALLKEGSLTRVGLERITENQAINVDTFSSRPGKIFIENHLGKFIEYYDYESKSTFRVTVLHPNPSEGLIGADLIYEQYDEKLNKVRIVAIQYKIWENETFYFSKSDNLQKQLSKMHKSFCDMDYCVSSPGGKNICEDSYRLSYCMAFLKPTDKLQNPKKLTTTGYHIPICKIAQVKESTKLGHKLTLNSIKKQSLKTASFDELFDAEMLGSRWLDVSELEKFYQSSKVLEPKERIILYAQALRKTK